MAMKAAGNQQQVKNGMKLWTNSGTLPSKVTTKHPHFSKVGTQFNLYECSTWEFRFVTLVDLAKYMQIPKPPKAEVGVLA
mmetsp:Transcript_26286/g.47363  ORF Transcript_26286/g.47363 Transcript_26286/m.47363 type:complete len:80 (-) Transcript_26286:93-332(-)